MKLNSVEKLEDGRAKLTIEIGSEEFENALEQAYKQGRGKMNVPGFRKGKAPRKIIEKMYGATIFYDDAINLVYPGAYSEAVKESELNIVGNPELDIVEISAEKGFTFNAVVELYPEVTVGEYKGLSAELASAEVQDEDVDKEIETLRERNARLVSVERPAADGDTAVIDFEGFVDGVAFEGGKGENYSLKLGSGSFIPGFEEKLVGALAGESKDVEVTFPEDYSENLSGKSAIFKCFVHEVKENEKPDADDEFAKDVSEYDTLEELKKSINTRLIGEKGTAVKEKFETAIIEKLLEVTEAKIPGSMVDAQIDQIIENSNYQMQMQGYSFEQYMQMLGMDMATVRASYRNMAEKQVKLDLAVKKIAELEQFEVSEDEIEAQYATLAENYAMEADKLKTYISVEDLTADIKSKKAKELVISSAIALEPSAEAEPVAEKAE